LSVATHERSDEERAKIVAAGHAAASWVRARRATWTDVPLPKPRAAVSHAPVIEPPATIFKEAPATLFKEAPAPVEPDEPGMAERAGEWVESAKGPIAQWLPRMAMAAAAVAVVFFGGRYVIGLVSSVKPRLGAARGSATPVAAKTTGSLRVSSAPAGARVIVDGTPRGVTPITIDDLALGRHTVVLESAAGTIERTVAVAPDAVAEIDESIFSGFVTIFSPFEVTVAEGTRALRPDDRNEIMLPPGRHDIRISNRALGFEEVRHVELKPGQKATISLSPPKSAITVTSSEAGEVWIDGTRIGDAPVTNAPVDLGTHEILVKRSAGGERRFTVTVTVRPALLNVDFSRP